LTVNCGHIILFLCPEIFDSISSLEKWNWTDPILTVSCSNQAEAVARFCWSWVWIAHGILSKRIVHHL